MKATLENYRKLSIAMYEFTGLDYYILPYCNQHIRGTNFFVNFYDLKKQVQSAAATGIIPNFQRINLLTKQKVPYIYNSINF